MGPNNYVQRMKKVEYEYVPYFTADYSTHTIIGPNKEPERVHHISREYSRCGCQIRLIRFHDQQLWFTHLQMTWTWKSDMRDGFALKINCKWEKSSCNGPRGVIWSQIRAKMTHFCLKTMKMCQYELILLILGAK